MGELTSRQRIAEHQRRRKEYLEQAAKVWQGRDKKSRGGEIAYYYAEKVNGWRFCGSNEGSLIQLQAREFQELAKQEALENARNMVLQKR